MTHTHTHNTLHALCDPKGHRPYITQPWTLPKGSPFATVATDGHAALFMVATVAGCDIASAYDAKKLLSVATPKGDAHEVAFADLLAWLGKYRPPETCDGCGGKGTHVCEECDRDGAKCWDCSGDGTVPVVELGFLFDALIDCNLAARFLRGLLAERITVTTQGYAPVGFDAPGWRVMLMPVDPGTNQDIDLKAFYVAATVPT